MDFYFGPWEWTLSKDCSLASNPSTKPQSATLQAEWFQQKIQAIANTQPEYNIGLVVQSLLEGTTNSIQVVQYYSNLVPKEKYITYVYVIRENTRIEFCMVA